MPDIQSEMSKVLDEWNKPESTTMTTPHQKITTNTTRVTFNRVAENPGITRAKLLESLSLDGYKQSSTSSLVTQMLANGNFRLVGDGLFVTQENYKPLPRLTPVKHRVKKDVPPDVPETNFGNTAAPQINAAWDADTLLNNLSIKQARALYDELRKIFGG